MVTIQSENLVVDFANAGNPYLGQRFDQTSLVLQVRDRAGLSYLGTQLPGGDPSGLTGFGLCSEFGLRNGHGYPTTLPGNRFTKIGVGSMLRDSLADYDFAATYPGFQRAPLELEIQADQAVFRCHSVDCNKLSWELERTWMVRDRELVCSTNLTNTGQLVIATEEYCHNFLKPGHRGELSSPGLELVAARPFRTLPSPLVDPASVTSWGPESLRFLGPSQNDIWAPDICIDNQGLLWWEVREGRKPWLREELDSPASHMDIWAKDHVISPELFINLDLAPGTARTWTRRWIFGSLAN